MLVWHGEPEVFVSHDHEQRFEATRYRCWSRVGIILSLYIPVALFSSPPLFVQCTSPSTNFSYPTFGSVDDFILFGKTKYDAENLSFTIDASGPVTRRLACVKLFHRDKVQTKNAGNLVGSFRTSFTFSITPQEGLTNRSGWLAHVVGFAFTFFSENITNLFQSAYGEPRLNYFSIEFDTYNSYADADPSDNHIGVDIDSLKSAYTYNLCGGQKRTCSFPWTGRTYTAWIDYDGSTRSLEVWFTNGSLAQGITKPAGPGVIKVPKIDLTDILENYMYVGFSGTSGPFLDTHEVLSWSFENSYPEAIPGPALRLNVHFCKSTIVVVCGTISLGVVSLLGCYLRKQRLGKSEPGLELELLVGLRRFTFRELKKATNNFPESTVLGKGGFGSVYKGTLTPSGMVVAVKWLKHGSEHVQREFLAEVSSISQIRHRNLVHLQGWCHEDGHFILVFDYMSNGSLDEWLFPHRRRYPCDAKYKKFEVLPWEYRFSILAGVAAAVEYLHEECAQCVLHRDIKSSNVMLDADFNPHLGDFGLARLIDHKKRGKTTMMAGTFGYMAPEMHYTGKATKESDVYSFGILVLEVACGRHPVNLQVEDPDADYMVLQAVWRAYEGGNILSAVEPGLLNLLLYQHLATKCSTEASRQNVFFSSVCNLVRPVNDEPFPSSNPVVVADATFNVRDMERKVVALLHLGLQCCLPDPKSRPSMRVVKHAIMQLQGSTVEEDQISPSTSMPPLPSTVLVSSSFLQVPTLSIGATDAPLDELEASLMHRSDTLSVLRRRSIQGSTAPFVDNGVQTPGTLLVRD